MALHYVCKKLPDGKLKIAIGPLNMREAEKEARLQHREDRRAGRKNAYVIRHRDSPDIAQELKEDQERYEAEKRMVKVDPDYLAALEELASGILQYYSAEGDFSADAIEGERRIFAARDALRKMRGSE